MSEGGCYCGNVRYKSTGEAQAKALCHCKDCRKISGSTYSTNIIVPGDSLTWTKGKPKEHTVTADSGNPITSFFCGDCGSTMVRGGPSFGENKIIKVGTLDEPSAHEDAKPAVELYAKDRVSWVSSVGGAGQKVAMPNSADA
ncbi:hypothetical protein AC579_7819 [Pseudocercospora musae]|uniref:CENP-V/GFA domain-containing protein n=1 Tax=Pseudocercospora musae TaxID=113226 RepID=A0A139I466_9PEZI|nr:hypothetical protein AC579_7819 [Pseudocercospora musae]